MMTVLAYPLDTWMNGDVGAGWWIPMVLMMVLFWGAVIFGIAWFIRTAARDRPGRGESPESPATKERPASREGPVEILERRFAEGAISPEDYRARRGVLLNGTAHSNGAREDEPLTAPRAVGGRQ